MTSGQHRSTLNRWWPAIAWTIFILVASTARVKGPGIEVPGIGLDKVVHFAIYFLLAILWYRALQAAVPNTRKRFWYTFFAAASYGIAMEGLQWAFFPERSFELWDIVANISGSIAALLALHKRME